MTTKRWKPPQQGRKRPKIDAKQQQGDIKGPKKTMTGHRMKTKRLVMRQKMTTTRLNTTEWRCKTTTRRIKTTTLTQKWPRRDSKWGQRLRLLSDNPTHYITKSTGKFRGRLQCSASLKSCLTPSVYKLYRRQLTAWLTGLVSGIKIYCVANVFLLICGQYCLVMSHSGLWGNFGCSGGAERRDDFPTTSSSRQLGFKINLQLVREARSKNSNMFNNALCQLQSIFTQITHYYHGSD